MTLECDHIRNEFSALLDNELNPEDRELVEEHLSDCSECLRELHGYKVVSELYRYHHPVKAPDDFEERFHAAIAPVGRKRAFPWRRWGVLAAAGFTLVAGTALWQSQRLMSSTAPEMASSRAMDAAPSPEPAPEAPQTMMFQAPSGAADSGLATDQGESDATIATEIGLQERGALESDDATLSDLEALQDADATAAGGQAAAMSAPAPSPQSLPVDTETAPMQAARKVDENTVAMKPEAAEAPAPTVAPPAESLMRAEETSSTPLRWKDQSFNLLNGAWRPTDYADEATTKIAIPSTAWNALRDQHPDLAALCDRKEPVIVKLDDVWYMIAKDPPPRNVER